MIRASGFKPNLWVFVLVAWAATGCELSTRNSQPLQSSGDNVGSGGSSSGSSSSGSTGNVTPDPLALTSISPTKVSFKSGGLVTFKGTGFTARTRLLIAGLPCPSPSIDSSTQATCFVAGTSLTVPVAIGPVKVRVYNYDAPATFYEKDLMFVSDGFSMMTKVDGTVSAGQEVDGIGSVAVFQDIKAMTVVGNTLYLADSDNYAIRKVDLTTFQVTTLAGGHFTPGQGTLDDVFGSATFYDPFGMVAVGTDTLYITDENCIRKIDLANTLVVTVAGVCGLSGAVNGTGPAARFNGPIGLETDGTYLYVGDQGNNQIRKVALADYSVTTLAGQRTAGKTDLPGTSAKFRSPGALTRIGGKLYVADTGNFVIRVVDTATAQVSTLTGGAARYADGTGNKVGFNGMDSLTTDGTDLFLVDDSNKIVRRIVVATGEVRLLAGVVENTGTSDDVDGTIDVATFSNPTAIAFHPMLGLLVGGPAVWQVQ